MAEVCFPVIVSPANAKGKETSASREQSFGKANREIEPKNGLEEREVSSKEFCQVRAGVEGKICTKGLVTCHQLTVWVHR